MWQTEFTTGTLNAYMANKKNIKILFGIQKMSHQYFN